VDRYVSGHQSAAVRGTALPLLMIAVLATYTPARHASLIDPMEAQRDE
jgi:ABC-type lipoprotein release transport system permease subunit